MQHTLLPTQERRSLRFEYRLRALVVLCFALAVAGVIGIGSLFPSYMAASIDEHRALSDLASIKKADDSSGLTAVKQQVAIGQNLLTVLSLNSMRPPISALIQSIVALHQDVTIDSIGAAYTATTTAVITVNGTAPSRDALLAFKSRIETNEPDSQVDLPVSQLAKASNIDYAIQITLKVQ